MYVFNVKTGRCTVTVEEVRVFEIEFSRSVSVHKVADAVQQSQFRGYFAGDVPYVPMRLF